MMNVAQCTTWSLAILGFLLIVYRRKLRAVFLLAKFVHSSRQRKRQNATAKKLSDHDAVVSDDDVEEEEAPPPFKDD